MSSSSSSSSNEERNFGNCSPFESSSSMDERSSKTLEALLREHDEDSTITEFSLPKIRATLCIPGDFDLSLSGVHRELTKENQELARMSSRSLPEDDQETGRKIIRGSRKACRDGGTANAGGGIAHTQFFQICLNFLL
ncbi:hypothetical protein B296_00021707 [Ensete ventricosum]|uniref:Uncharacterized protein n=1 Tax=Ensete ventricosum TaxID=4639 RepID=A0A426ZA15_ENSVE|nr:hypothetical protein B296_00021707 [Ensete ventricosum]